MSDDLVVWLREEIAADKGRWLAFHAVSAVGGGSLGRDVIADGDAKLAILGLYEREADRLNNAEQEGRTWLLADVVRLLGAGYQHRPGYREEWKP